MMLTRRNAIALAGVAAAAAAALGLPAAAAPAIGVDGGATDDLSSFAVGTPGEWDWRVIRARTEDDALLRWIEEYSGETKCSGDANDPDFEPDYCECEFCRLTRAIEAERHPEWDGKPVETGDATWFMSGLGANCSRCSYETFLEEDGRVVDEKVVCHDCMTIADWEKVDPERARDMRDEDISE